MAYTAASIFSRDFEADGRLHLEIEYTGDAGEVPVHRPIYINALTPPSMDEIRAQAISQLSVLNTSRSMRGPLVPGTVLDTTTALPVPAQTIRQYYMAASLPFTPGATPQDVFTITGSATKTVTVLRMGISTTQTTAGINTWHLLRRSTANSLGTSAAISGVASNNGATATATVLQYTANPTAGNLVGRLWSGRLVSPAPATVGFGDLEKAIQFPLETNPIVLSGTNQVVAWNFNGAVLPTGLSVTAWIWWTEI